MDSTKELEIKDISERILAKRQQVDFEKNSIGNETLLDPDNRENPDVSEAFKNDDDPAEEVIEQSEWKELRDAENELDTLVERLNKLKGED